MLQEARRKLYRSQQLIEFIPLWLSNHSDTVEDAELRLTWRCNARCIMCDIWQYSHDNDDALKEETGIKSFFRHQMNTDEARDLITQLKQMGLRSLAISGGEPTLRRDLPQIIKHAVDSSVRVRINTNGAPITEKRAFELVEAGLHQINFSMDGPTREVHDRIRGEGIFDNAVAGMKALKRASQELNRPIHLHVHCVVMGINHRVLDQYLDVREEWGWDSLSFGPMLNGEYDDWQQLNSAKDSTPLTPEVIRHIVDVVAPRIAEKAMQQGIAVPAIPFGITDEEIALNAKDYYNKPEQFCTVAWRETVIQPNGDVLPCCYAPNEMALGNVLEKPFHELYNDAPYVRFRANSKPTAFPMCRSCIRYRRRNEQFADMLKLLNSITSPFRPAQMPPHNGASKQGDPIVLLDPRET